MAQLFINAPMALIILVFLAALFLLSKSTDLLIDAAMIISKSLGISDVIIGATIVSLGTSLPEFATTISALISSSNDLALGNSLGSIITNTSFVLGVGILCGNMPISKKSSLNIWLVFLGLVSICLTSISYHSLIPRFLGYILLMTLPIYLYKSFKNNNSDKSINNQKMITEKTSFKKFAIYFIKMIILGLLVALSSSFLVATVQVSANRIGISEGIISATIVALGTSLPELSTVISSVKKGYGGLAFGNLVGASLMNILFVLSTTIAFSKLPIMVPNSFLFFHFPLAIAIFIYLLYCVYKSKKHEFTKKEGLFFIFIYIIYIAYNLLANI